MVEAHVSLERGAIHFLERIGDLRCVARKACDVGWSSNGCLALRFVGGIPRAYERRRWKRGTAGRASGEHRRKRHPHCPFDNGMQYPHRPHPIPGLVILVLSLLGSHRRIEMKPMPPHTGVYFQNGHLALATFYPCCHRKLRIRPFWGSSIAAIRPKYAPSRLIEARPHGSQTALRG